MSVANNSYPANMSMIAKRLVGLSRNTLRLLPMGTTSAGPSDIIRFVLPANCIVHLPTLALFFTGVSSAIAQASSTAFSAMPRNIENLVQRYEVTIGGKVITFANNSFNHLANVVFDLTAGVDKKNNRILQNAIGPAAAPSTADTSKLYAIQNFIGCIQSMSPEYLNTRITGNVEVTLYMSPSNVLATGGTGVASCTYSLTNIFASVDVIDIQDGVYSSLIDTYLANGGVYEYVYRNWASFSGPSSSLTATTNFSLSTQSMNKVLCFFTEGSGNGHDATLRSSKFCQRIGDACTHQVCVNGVLRPTYQVTSQQAFALFNNMSGHSWDLLGGSIDYLSNLDDWEKKFFCLGIQLDHNDGQFISGLNTQGNSAASYWQCSSTTATSYTNVIARVLVECTSSLLIGANRQIDVIS